MIQFVKNNSKSLSYALLITLGLFLMLQNAGVAIFPEQSVPQTIVILGKVLAYSLLFMVLYFLVKRYTVFRLTMVLSLLVLSFVSERLLKVSKNPFSIPLIILFFIGVCSLLLPMYFKKYKSIILLIYGLVIVYYLFYFTSNATVTENHRVYFSKYILLPIPFFFGLWVYEQWRWLQELKAEKAQTELELLKSQINPHFFFNTLNNLYGLVIEKSDLAPSVVLKLSEMMRYTIYNGKEEKVLLKDEADYLKNYIDLHKIRFHKVVDIRFEEDFDETLKLPPLLFIILLENAIKHGVEKMGANAYIAINLFSDDDGIHFRIENNYINDNALRAKGIGLDNLKKRLELLFPNAHELIIFKDNTTYRVDLKIALK